METLFATIVTGLVGLLVNGLIAAAVLVFGYYFLSVWFSLFKADDTLGECEAVGREQNRGN